jgi:hypothetical protein
MPRQMFRIELPLKTVGITLARTQTIPGAETIAEDH